MKITKCPVVENHFYDGDAYFQCPYCNGESQSKIRKKLEPVPVDNRANIPAPGTSNAGEADVTVGMFDDEDVTVAMYDQDGQSDGTDEASVTLDMTDYGSYDEHPAETVTEPAQNQIPVMPGERIDRLPLGNGRQRCANCFEEYAENVEQCPYCGYKPGDRPKELYHIFQGLILNNRYIIGEVLGFGGFGITYKAWDKKLDSVVAIKEYYPSGIVSRAPGTKEVMIYAQKRSREYQVGKERFLKEARNMAKFNSEKNIVNVFEFFEENNTAYIVMEYLKGQTLSQMLHSKGKVDVAYGIKVTNAVCNALSRLHSEGIIHRDVSPDNIFICSDGGIKLIDFGAARFSNDENKKMTIILKPGFAPPEQYEKINKQGPWTDVYALGASLYYIITGEKPEESTNRKISDKLPYPHTLNREIPTNLSNAIMKAMSIDIHLRFKSVNDFADAINKNKKILRIDDERKRRKKLRIIGITAAFALLAGGIAFSVFRWNKGDVLPDSDLKIWYCKSGDKEKDEAEKNAYEKIISEFKDSYPNVKIELEGFDEGEYKAKLKSTDDQPNIYEYIGENSSDKALSLKDVFDSDSAKECSLLSSAKETYGNYEYLPYGFTVPIFFANRALVSSDFTTVKNLDDISYTVSVDDDLFKKIYNISDSLIKSNASDLFCSDEIAVYGTVSSNFDIVSEKMPARFNVVYCDTDKIYCRYTNVFCANDKDKDANKAVLKLLEYMLNKNAQDSLHLRYNSGSLPVNDSVIDLYKDVYKQMDKIADNKERFVFEK